MTGVGFATQANTNVKALKTASEYCDKLGKHLVTRRNSESGVYGFSPRQSNLTFLSLDADDPDYTHGKIQTSSTVSNQRRRDFAETRIPTLRHELVMESAGLASMSLTIMEKE